MAKSGISVLVAAALTLGALSAPAFAGARLKERVYDDSFGNLVIISPSGYKRIVVGKGYIAAEMEAERRAALAEDLGPIAPRRQGWRAGCHQPPVLWKGRGYMYGLPDGVVPTPPIVCE